MLARPFKIVENPSEYSDRFRNGIITGALIAMMLSVVIIAITTVCKTYEAKCAYCGNHIAASDATVYMPDGKTYHVSCFKEVESGKN